jgi:two-component system nitrogen regulation response regulator GlnG
VATSPFLPVTLTSGDIPTIEEAASALFDAFQREGEGRELLPWVEEDFTRRAMAVTSNNQVKASKLLGITRATLRKRLERLNGTAAQE